MDDPWLLCPLCFLVGWCIIALQSKGERGGIPLVTRLGGCRLFLLFGVEKNGDNEEDGAGDEEYVPVGRLPNVDSRGNDGNCCQDSLLLITH